MECAKLRASRALVPYVHACLRALTMGWVFLGYFLKKFIYRGD